MVHEKDSTRIEDTAAVKQNEHDTMPQTSSGIHHRDTEIVVDIGSEAVDSVGTSDLKLAKDGHVSLNGSLFESTC